MDPRDEGILAFGTAAIQNLRALPRFGQLWTSVVLVLFSGLAVAANHLHEGLDPIQIVMKWLEITRIALGNQYIAHMTAQGTGGKIPGLPMFNQAANQGGK